MKSKYIGLAALFLLISLNLGISGYYYSAMPEQVASQFDFDGNATSWMEKDTFVIFNAAMIFLMPAILLTLAWGCTKLPPGMVNMPNRDYWLSPERKAETAAILFRQILWLTNGVVLFLTALVALVYRANLGQPEAMRKTPLVLVGVFLAFMAGWIVCFYAKFRKVPPT